MVRILLIEDDSTITAGLAYSLEQEGWSVTCKGTLAQGRNALETGEYQLLLVDVGLPDGSGYDLCAAAKMKTLWEEIIQVSETAPRISPALTMMICHSIALTKTRNSDGPL